MSYQNPSELVRHGQPEIITIHAFDWVEDDKEKEGGDNFHIRCWALDRESNPVCAIVDDFTCWAYVELPGYIDNRIHKWSSRTAAALFKCISNANGVDPDGWIRNDKPWQFLSKKKLYYYNCNQTFPFLKLSFRTKRAMTACLSILRNGLYFDPTGGHNAKPVKFNVHEDYITPVRKLLSIQNVKYSGWFTARAYPVVRGQRVTTLDLEYVIDWDTMKPVPPDECRSWSTQPGVMAMDIECYSNNHRRMPDKTNDAHCAYMISAIYQIYKRDETRQRYCIIIGEANHIPASVLENTTVYMVKDEAEMMDCYAFIMKHTNPTIVTGYNILSFDYPYLNHRIKRNLDFWPVLGRMHGQRSHVITSTWNSGAYGHNIVNTLVMEGRISIDMLPIIKRDMKMDNYTLDYVCNTLIGKSKNTMSAPTMFKIYEEMRNTCGEMVRLRRFEQDNPAVAQDPEFKFYLSNAVKAYEDAKERTTEVILYCIQDSELVLDLMHHCDVWVSLVQMSNVVGVTIVEVFTRGQQIRCVSQIYDLASRKENNIVIDKIEQVLYKYSGGSVMTPVLGLSYNVICLDFASLYPSIIMAYNICYTTLIPRELWHTVPDEACHIIPFTQEEVEENVPTPVRPKATEENMYDELLPEGEEADEKDLFREVKQPGKRVKVEKKTKTVEYCFRFLKDPKDNPEYGRAGILPTLVRTLVSERRATQAVGKEASDPVVKANMEKLQLALKVAANSLYGFLGVQTNGMLPLLPAAMCVTAKGRELLGMVRDHVEKKHNGRIIYGDTDSVMFDLNIKDPAVCYYWGVKLAQEISGVKAGDDLPDGSGKHEKDVQGLFIAPLAMAFEKVMLEFLILAKKRYLATLGNKNGKRKMVTIKDRAGKVIEETNEVEILKRGVVLVRRDNIPFLRDIYSYIAKKILMGGDFLECMNHLIDRVEDMYAGRVDYTQFISTRSLGASYKSTSYFMKIFADKLEEAGKIIVPGERLPFVVVTASNGGPGTKPLLGYKMRMTEQYLERRDDPTVPTEELDYNYYLEKVLSRPLSQLIATGFKHIIERLWWVDHKPKGNAKRIDLTQPIKYILKMREEHYPLGFLREALKTGIEYLKQVGDLATIKPIRPEPIFKCVDDSLAEIAAARAAAEEEERNFRNACIMAAERYDNSTGNNWSNGSGNNWSQPVSGHYYDNSFVQPGYDQSVGNGWAGNSTQEYTQSCMVPSAWEAGSSTNTPWGSGLPAFAQNSATAAAPPVPPAAWGSGLPITTGCGAQTAPWGSGPVYSSGTDSINTLSPSLSTPITGYPPFVPSTNFAAQPSLPAFAQNMTSSSGEINFLSRSTSSMSTQLSRSTASMTISSFPVMDNSTPVPTDTTF